MPKSTNQKQKMLLILDYLQKHTDETHDATTPQLIDYLAANGIKAERKSIYNDIQTLIDFGYDIVRGPGPHDGYQLLSQVYHNEEVARTDRQASASRQRKRCQKTAASGGRHRPQQNA